MGPTDAPEGIGDWCLIYSAIAMLVIMGPLSVIPMFMIFYKEYDRKDTSILALVLTALFTLFHIALISFIAGHNSDSSHDISLNNEPYHVEVFYTGIGSFCRVDYHIFKRDLNVVSYNKDIPKSNDFQVVKCPEPNAKGITPYVSQCFYFVQEGSGDAFSGLDYGSTQEHSKLLGDLAKNSISLNIVMKDEDYICNQSLLSFSRVKK